MTEAVRQATATDLTDGESTTAVGVRLREIRAGRRLTLKTVADRAGISEGFLSQIERGRSAPSLKTFRRIAMALGVDLADVLSHDDVSLPELVPHQANVPVRIGGLVKLRLSPPSITTMHVLRGVFDVGASAGPEPYTHGDSDEVFIVVHGLMEAEVDGRRYTMSAGDSLNYRSTMPHTFHNRGDERAEVLWIISPPS